MTVEKKYPVWLKHEAHERLLQLMGPGEKKIDALGRILSTFHAMVFEADAKPLVVQPQTVIVPGPTGPVWLDRQVDGTYEQAPSVFADFGNSVGYALEGEITDDNETPDAPTPMLDAEPSRNVVIEHRKTLDEPVKSKVEVVVTAIARPEFIKKKPAPQPLGDDETTPVCEALSRPPFWANR